LKRRSKLKVIVLVIKRYCALLNNYWTRISTLPVARMNNLSDVLVTESGCSIKYVSTCKVLHVLNSNFQAKCITIRR